MPDRIHSLIGKIDRLISRQLAEIMHHQNFQRLEGSWRGLKYLVANTATAEDLKVKFLDLKKAELIADFECITEGHPAIVDSYTCSRIFRKWYLEHFYLSSGEPFASMTCDFEFTHDVIDVQLLSHLANIAAIAFCPVIASAGSDLFGHENWIDMIPIEKVDSAFNRPEYHAWNRLRNKPETRFIYLCIPRALARRHYSPENNDNLPFAFNEIDIRQDTADPAKFTWMSAAYPMARAISRSFSEYGYATNVFDSSAGGRIDDLPLQPVLCDDGDIEYSCCTEIAIDAHHAAYWNRLGLLPLANVRNCNFSVYVEAVSLHKQPVYEDPDATANAAISCTLPYTMAISRFMHNLLFIAREFDTSLKELDVAMEEVLNRWLSEYSNASADTATEKARYPIAGGSVRIQRSSLNPEEHVLILWARPWLTLYQLSTELRSVACIPFISDADKYLLA